MTWFFRPVVAALLALGAPLSTLAAPLDLPEPGARDAAAVTQALQRFGQAFKAKHLAAAEGAARDAWLAGGGTEALEALAVTALHGGRVPRAHQLYVAILAEASAPADVQRRAANQLGAMERQTGDLTIRGGADGAVVTIDGDAITRLPLVVAPRAMPGRRVVTVGAYETTVRFAAGRTTQVVVPAGASGAAIVAPVVPVAAAAAAVSAPTALVADAREQAETAAREAVADAREQAETAAREAVAGAREQLTEAALARPEVQAALEARDRALEARDRALETRDRALKARAALAKLRPERLRELIQNDPELKRALAALTDDQAVLQQVALAMQSGGGVEGVGRQLANDARVQRVLARLKTLLLVETGVQEVIE